MKTVEQVNDEFRKIADAVASLPAETEKLRHLGISKSRRDVLAGEIKNRIFESEIGMIDFSLLCKMLADFQLRIQELENLHPKDEEGYRVAYLKFWKMEARDPDPDRQILIICDSGQVFVGFRVWDESNPLDRGYIISGTDIGWYKVKEWAYLDGGE